MNSVYMINAMHVELLPLPSMLLLLCGPELLYFAYFKGVWSICFVFIPFLWNILSANSIGQDLGLPCMPTTLLLFTSAQLVNVFLIIVYIKTTDHPFPFSS